MFSTEQQIVANAVKELREIVPVIDILENQLPNNITNLQFLSNTAFLCRKANEILKSIEKKLNDLEYKTAACACVTLATAELPKYQGENCTISPNSEFYVKYPASPREPGYEEFVKQLPVDCVRPHYPTVQEKITEAIGLGLPIPFGLEGIKSVQFKLRVTTKNEL